MATNLAVSNPAEIAEIAEKTLIGGDLSKLSPQERVQYYLRTCESLNLNPLTKPFEYITLNGKLTLYAKRDATDQLRRGNNISIKIISRDRLDGVYIVSAQASTPDGRTDESTGVVAIENLKGDNLANALMKAETKAKRRATLSICGLGMMDETETETTPARYVDVNTETGEIIESHPSPAHTTSTAPANNDAASEKQIKYAHSLCAKKFGTKEQNPDSKTEFIELCSAIAGRAIKHTTELTKPEISKLIEELNEMEDYVVAEEVEADIFDFSNE